MASGSSLETESVLRLLGEAGVEKMAPGNSVRKIMPASKPVRNTKKTLIPMDAGESGNNEYENYIKWSRSS